MNKSNVVFVLYLYFTGGCSDDHVVPSELNIRKEVIFTVENKVDGRLNIYFSH